MGLDESFKTEIRTGPDNLTKSASFAAKEKKGGDAWQQIFDEGVSWIRSTYREKFSSIYDEYRQNIENFKPVISEKFSYLNAQLARTLSIISAYSPIKDDSLHQGGIYRALYQESDKSSLIGTAKDQKERDYYYAQLTGMYSILTARDLIREVGKKTDEARKPMQVVWLTSVNYADFSGFVVTDTETDVYSKVDLAVSFGDRNRLGKPIVHLIQLKVDKYGGCGISDVYKTTDPEKLNEQLKQQVRDNRPGISNSQAPFSHKIEEHDCKRMLEYAERLKELSGVDARVHVVVVPSVESGVVNKSFGFLRTEYKEVVTQRFVKSAENTSFLPNKI